VISVSRAGSMRSPVVVIYPLAFKFASDNRGRASSNNTAPPRMPPGFKVDADKKGWRH
jgi:hypothetical protein